MKRERLLIVGASARAAAWSARRAGWEPWAVDQFADSDLTAICHAVRVRDLRGESIAAMGSCPAGAWIYTGPLENHPDLVTAIRQDRPLWGNSADTLRAVRDPQRVARVLRAAGVPCPDVQPFAGIVPPGTWIRKPFRSGGGHGLVILRGRLRRDRGDAAPPRNAETPPPVSAATSTPRAGECFLQRRVPGTACSAVFVAARRQAVLLGATLQLVGCRWAGAARFGYVGSLISSTITDRHRAAFARIGDVLAGEFSLSGLFGVDAVINARGVWPVEVNPRYTASVELLERACGWHAIGWHVAACRDETLPRVVPRGASASCGKAVLYARQSLVIERPLHDFARRANAGRAWPRVADVPAIGERLRTGQPLVTVFAEGDTTTAARRRLRRLAQTVHGILRGESR